MPKHAEQFEALITKKVDAIIIAMGKPIEADAQFKAARKRHSGDHRAVRRSPYALFDIETNEYKVGADGTLYLLGVMGYQGNLLYVRFEPTSHRASATRCWMSRCPRTAACTSSENSDGAHAKLA